MILLWLFAIATFVIFVTLLLLKANSRPFSQLPAPILAGEIAWLVLTAIVGGLLTAGLLYLLWLLIS